MAVTAETEIDLEEVGRELAEARPQDILQWGVATYWPDLTMATALQSAEALLKVCLRLSVSVRTGHTTQQILHRRFLK